VTGIKVARTPSGQSTIADRNHYKYYNSETKTWQKTPLKKGEAAGNIITWSVPGPKNGASVGPNVGDVWYDPYFKTTVMMWNDAGIDATFWFRYAIDKQFFCLRVCSDFELRSYALSKRVEGPWSEPVGKFEALISDSFVLKISQLFGRQLYHRNAVLFQKSTSTTKATHIRDGILPERRC
jgi:hypothetical protein